MRECAWWRSWLVALVGVALAGGVRADDFFVDGRTGRDVPAAGRSAATPWKTIGYALGRIPRPPDARVFHTLRVAGSQVYSRGTNGERFPLTAAYNVSIVGTAAAPAAYPVLGVPVGETGIAFKRDEVYNRNQVTIRRLVFAGGSYGVRMGGDPGFRHRPRFWDCVFRGQAVAGIDMDMRGRAAEDPRVFRCTFEGAPEGIHGAAAGADAILFPDVEECVFRDLRSFGIWIGDAAGARANVGALIRSNRFERCREGVHVQAAANARSTNLRVFSCYFRDCTNGGVRIRTERSGELAITVERCGFFGGGMGVRLDGDLAPGAHTLTLRNNHAERVGGMAYRIGQLRGTGALRVASSDNVARLGGWGYHVWVEQDGVRLSMDSLRDRVIGTNNGFVTLGLGSAGRIRLQSGMLTNIRGTAVDFGSAMPSVARSLTLADNGTALRLSARGSRVVDHIVFTGNVRNVTGLSSARVNYSCLNGTSWPGTGNITADPLLLRPHYKLAFNSPCIDRGDVATPLPATDYEGDERAAVGRVGGRPLPDIGADEYRLKGSVRRYGVPGFGLGNAFPAIDSPAAEPVIGSGLRVDLRGAIDAASTTAQVAVLAFGLGERGTLPTDLAGIGAAGSYLWQDLRAALPPRAVDRTGRASVSLRIPADARLIGSTFLLQWLTAWPGVNAAGILTTDALRVTVGR